MTSSNVALPDLDILANLPILAVFTPKLLLVSILAFIGGYFLYSRHAPLHPAYSISMSPSPNAGWHARAQPSPRAFVPTRDALVFAVLLNAQADHDGFTLALFRPDVAVDARGAVLTVDPADFARLAELAQQTTTLPPTGSFMNAWRVAHDRTEQKIDRLFAATSTDGPLVQTSVQGYSPRMRQLKPAVGDVTELPDVLQELFGYIQEGREGFIRGEEDKEIIARVKALVNE
ncbi:hypothetical protein A0H81_04158 [Grifola frondosa]|uniref:Uncharacterized protein n=1 Tax=Grifola frondosa TaxID=5627 RepID=A0A1C7MG38_GRIFR|nr:hypothetical protein A0H81_04158 [Grifola frondosa]